MSCKNGDLNSNEQFASTPDEADIKLTNHISRTARDLGKDCNGKASWEEISPLRKVQLFFSDVFATIGLGRRRPYE